MSLLPETDALFFADPAFDLDAVQAQVREALVGLDDGELFLEYKASESISLDDGRVKTAAVDSGRGFGLRGVIGDRFAYAHSTELSLPALKRASETIRAVRLGDSGSLALAPPSTQRALYGAADPLAAMPFKAKVDLLAEIDAYTRAKDPRVVQVSASLSGNWQAVQILRPGSDRVADVRPLVRLNVSVIVAQGDRQEVGYHGVGGRTLYDGHIAHWQAVADEALRQALLNLESIPAPAGEMTVVMGPGWPGVMLHEAVGHGLEGDFNRKKTSAFAGLMGQRVAAPGVTVVDDGTLQDRRGSLSIDDEGTPTQRTTLIEDGILVGYMQDRMNARLMGMAPTGNGRRQSFADFIMPRMTNTVMLSGDTDPGEILASVKKGVYAVNFGGGQVDITSGKFVFSMSEAYQVENGRIGAPLKGATLIGNGPDALTKVTMVGNDSALDTGIGTCGKDGQMVPVGVGQPTLAMEGLTVGGTG